MAAGESVQTEIPAELNIAHEFVSRPARAHPECIAILGEPRPSRAQLSFYTPE